MTYIKSIINIFLFLLKAAFTLIILMLIFVKAVEWGLYFAVVKPKAEDIAFDLTTYVEANDQTLSDEWLKAYVHNKRNSTYLKDNEWVEVSYLQYGNDRRFKIKVSLRAEYLDGSVSTAATIETQSINFGETPTASIYSNYGNLYSMSSDMLVKDNEDTNDEKGKGSQDLKEDQKKKEDITEKTISYTSISEDEVKEFVEEYVELGIEAINKNDFSYIEPMLDPLGESYLQSQNAVDKVNSQVRQEELLEFQANSVIILDEFTYKVSTYEEYRITYDDGKVKVKGYNSDYLLKEVDEGHLAMNKTLNVNEVSSHELVDYGLSAEEIYKQTCIGCHGSNYEGGVGPSLYNVGFRYSEEEIVNILLNGKGSMPEGLVSEEEADSMVQYLLELDGGQ